MTEKTQTFSVKRSFCRLLFMRRDIKQHYVLSTQKRIQNHPNESDEFLYIHQLVSKLSNLKLSTTIIKRIPKKVYITATNYLTHVINVFYIII